MQQSQPAPVQVAKLPSQPPPSTKYGQSGCWTCESRQSLLQTELGYSVEEWGCEQVVSQSGMMGFSHLSSPSITTHHAGVLGGGQRREVLTPLHPLSCTRTCTSFLWLPQQITRHMVAKVNGKLFSCSSRSELQHQGVNQAILPAEVLEETPSLPLPASVAPSVPWLVAASL